MTKKKEIYTEIFPRTVILDDQELSFVDDVAIKSGQTRSQVLSGIMLLSLNKQMCRDHTNLVEEVKLVPVATPDDIVVQSTKP